MSLVRDLYRSWREERKRPTANAKKQIEFEEWMQNVTSDNVRQLFLATLTEGNEDLHSPVVKRSEIQYFDKVVADLAKSSEGEMKIDSVTAYILEAHAQDDEHEAVNRAAPILASLILAHAHFPFMDPVTLTRDALLRAILLLTHHVELPFAQTCQIGHEYEIRKHPEKARLRFIYSALAGSYTGVPTQDDILDIISRVKYPWQTWGKGIVRRQLLDDLKPLAKRLGSGGNAKVADSVPVERLELLRELVEAFPPRWGDPPSVVGFGGRKAVTARQFVEWAKKVRLLDALDQVYGVFVQAPHDAEDAACSLESDED